MKGEVLTVIVLLLKHYLCEAENVIVGSMKQLVCQIQNGNRWEKFSDELTLWETINNGGIYSGSNTSILTITNFQIENSGYFRCKEDGTASTGKIIELLPEVQAFIGSSVTLTCTVSGTPLYWYVISNSGIRTLTDNMEYEDSTTNFLKIKYLTANNAAVYYCKPIDRMKGPDITVSVSMWLTWTAWGECDAVCGTGQRERTRICSGSCSGDAIQTEQCTVVTKVDGGWSSWITTGTCTVSCGGGFKKRTRYCNNPPQSYCGAHCIGTDNDYISCYLSTCPVNGGWSSWDSWGACTVTCGTGKQSRGRYCNNPTPANGGAYCQGAVYDYNLCSLSACTDGEWSSWTSWEACNVTCGNGKQSRRRYCNNPLQANGGADCQGEENDFIPCGRSECTDQRSGNMPIVVGTVISVTVVVIVIMILVLYAKRRWYNSQKGPDYEITEMSKVKAHIYGETHANHEYQNDQHPTEIEVTTTDNYSNEAQIVDRYDVSDLTKRYQNREYFLQSLRAEFKLLNDSADDPKQLHSPYEIVNTGSRQDENQLHFNSSTLDVLYTNNVSVLLEPPQKDLAEQFWTIVDNQCVDNIILLAKGNEKISEFYPMLDDILRINNFEIYFDSAERMNKNIMLLTLNLQNKTTQSFRQIKLFKTNVSEFPTVQKLCFAMDKAIEIRGATVLIINSKMADLSICGVLTVCLNVIYAIKNGSLFSVLENATIAKNKSSSFFKKFDDYELSYKVLEHYLEAVHTYHTYDFIE